MIITAFPVGFFAGLFGIGGGLITVPFLFFIFEALDVNKIYLMHLAVGTSFAIIIPTSMVSVYTHNKHKSVDQNILKTYGLFVIIGVMLGTTFAALMKTKSLIIFFTIFDSLRVRIHAHTRIHKHTRMHGHNHNDHSALCW